MTNATQTTLEARIHENLSWLNRLVGARLGAHLRGVVDPEDVVQDALVEVLEYRERATRQTNREFRALLIRIVENNLRDRAKWLRRQCRNPLRERGLASDLNLETDAPCQSVAGPNQVLESRQEHEWIRLAVDQLSPQDREVVRLREWEKQPFDVIGAAIGCSANTARMRFQRALPRLAHKVAVLRGA